MSGMSEVLSIYSDKLTRRKNCCSETALYSMFGLVSMSPLTDSQTFIDFGCIETLLCSFLEQSNCHIIKNRDEGGHFLNTFFKLAYLQTLHAGIVNNPQCVFFFFKTRN